MSNEDPFASDTSYPSEPSGSYKCSDPDRCEWGEQCNGNHSYSHWRLTEAYYDYDPSWEKKGDEVVYQAPREIPVEAVEELDKKDKTVDEPKKDGDEDPGGNDCGGNDGSDDGCSNDDVDSATPCS